MAGAIWFWRKINIFLPVRSFEQITYLLMIYTHAYLFAKPLIARVRCRVRRSRHADSVSMTNVEKPPPLPGTNNFQVENHRARRSSVRGFRKRFVFFSHVPVVYVSDKSYSGRSKRLPGNVYSAENRKVTADTTEIVNVTSPENKLL